MATTETVATPVKPYEEVVQALREWAAVNLRFARYDIDSLDGKGGIKATTAVAWHAYRHPDNEKVFEAYVTCTASREAVEYLNQWFTNAHQDLELYHQVIAHLHHPGATEITNAVIQSAQKYAFDATH